MVLGGAFGDEQPLGDLPVGEPLGNQGGDLGLTRAERGRLFGAAVELRNERGGSVEVGNHAERLGEAVGVAGQGFGAVAITGLVRGEPGDRDRAEALGRDANGLAKSLGMAAYLDRTAALVAQFDRSTEQPISLSPREAEVGSLVAEGLTNRQIAERLFISERTAQNHVQHILTKLGFATRSQIAAWRVRTKE